MFSQNSYMMKTDVLVAFSDCLPYIIKQMESYMNIETFRPVVVNTYLILPCVCKHILWLPIIGVVIIIDPL